MHWFSRIFYMHTTKPCLLDEVLIITGSKFRLDSQSHFSGRDWWTLKPRGTKCLLELAIWSICHSCAWCWRLHHQEIVLQHTWHTSHLFEDWDIYHRMIIVSHTWRTSNNCLITPQYLLFHDVGWLRQALLPFTSLFK